jgi:hypothetical protein
VSGAAPRAPRRRRWPRWPSRLPGCGGRDEEAYGTAVNAFCTDVRASLRGFEREASAAGSAADSETAARAFGGAVERLFGRGCGDPPARCATPTARAVRALRRPARARLRGGGAPARPGGRLRASRRPGALRDIDRRLGDLDVPAAPPDLRRSAPACRS